VGRSVVRSVGRSVVRSVGRSVVRSVGSSKLMLLRRDHVDEALFIFDEKNCCVTLSGLSVGSYFENPGK
jgi:hypothetical protein